MPFDAVFLTAVAEELREKLTDSRVEKISQPARDTVILQLRGREGHLRLLATANPNRPRVQLTQMNYENPATPPMFCMLLRKHLMGGRLLQLIQPPMERTLELVFACTDEMGEACKKSLVVEMMSGAANLILTGEGGRIVDCMRRVDMEAARPVLPGLYYRPPARADRLDPTAVDGGALSEMLLSVSAPKRFDAWILEHFAGFSPLIAREISFTLTGETDTDLNALSQPQRRELAERLIDVFRNRAAEGGFCPVLLLRQDVPADFSFRPIRQYGDFMRMEVQPSFSALLDRFYGERDRAEKIRQRSQSIRKTVTNLYDRTTRKLANQRRELDATLNRERTRQLGDIVTANLYQIQRGQTVLRAEDFYDPQMRMIEIPLSPALSPQQNAAKLYKEYSKAKTAQRVLTEQIAKGETEQTYLGSVLDALSRAESEKDLNEIRTELTEGGYLRERGRGKQMKQPPSRPMEFRSSDGFVILVGRNNRQNDQLTTKTASKRDIWLHVQKQHGSHVIIQCDGAVPPDTTVTQAMVLAAYYSQAREGTLVPVDYCPVRQVKKPAGAKPGMVVYENYRTGYVTPTAAQVEALRR